MEQQARALDVERHVAELVQYYQVVPGDVPHRRLQRVLAVCLRQRQRELGGGVEPHGLPRHHRGVAQRDGQMGLTPAGLAVEHEVLRHIDERQRLEVLHGIPLGEHHLREVVALEGFPLRDPRPPVQAGAPVALAHLQLVFDHPDNAPELGGVGFREKPVDGVVGKVQAARQPAQRLGVALGPDGHGYTALLIASS